MRKKFIAANWKMNKTAAEAEAFIKEFTALKKTEGLEADIAVCVPFTSLAVSAKFLNKTCILSGAQNMHYEDKGAFTGEISANMLVAEGIRCVIIGHSERRQYFGETDVTVNKKVLKAIETGLLPIVCVGETLEQKENGTTKEVIKTQTTAALAGVKKEDLHKIVLAYEPIWAIGTGRTATAEDANNVIKYIRSVVSGVYGNEPAEQVRILYGGSLTAKNAKEIFSTSDIDGGLIGGASLNPNDFYEIIRCV